MSDSGIPSEHGPMHDSSAIGAMASSSISGDAFAFLVHSQESLMNGASGTEYQPSARTRRRRTSPEDQAILEAEYRRNSKPDKKARMEIVSRVALGEKEVQIWFQNRRQITRRRSRPAQPCEILPTLHASQESVEDSNTPISIIQTSSQCELLSSESDLGSSQRNEGMGGTRCIKHNSALNLNFKEEKTSRATSNQAGGAVGPLQHGIPADSMSSDRNEEDPDISSSPILGTSHTDSNNSKSPRGLKRVRSSIHLSMSLDGKAQVILDNRSSPSPPRSDRTGPSAKSERPYGLRRSQTDVLPGKQSALAFEDSLPQWPRQAVPGRSRDARTWEFYCDSDARNALTVQAEREQKGSAEGAIGLIRSSSNKGMKSKSVNQNLQRNAAKPTSKRKLCSGNNGPKPKLARTTSSVARLQTVDHKANMLAKQIEPENIKSSSQPAVYREPSGDSDKENWEPGAQVSNVRTRRGPSNFPGTQRAILKDSRIPSLSTSLGAFLESDLGAKQLLLKSQNVEAAAKNDAVVDEEVRAFMQEKNTDREKEDLDCVQNLLSLSQGIWK